jgi:4-diphosphocytidyl-2-C-methyl-D-erythritol kinase
MDREVGCLRVKASAKVNLSLEVLGKRTDGYHEVRSVMQSIDIVDELWLERSTQLALAADDEGLAGEDNLVVRAAELLRHERGQTLGAAMRLKKGIPVAAGLGGGSADAAAALVGLEQLWGPRLSPEQIATLASSLGSDVPFFLRGGTALALGRGEVIRPIARGLEAWLVLLVPPHSVPGKTAKLYGSLSAELWTSGERTLLLAEAISRGRGIAGELMVNSFESIASRLFPELATHRAAMLESGASSVHLSGAGPAIFALLPAEQEASSIAARLSERGYNPLVARTLGSQEARLSPRPARAP